MLVAASPTLFPFATVGEHMCEQSWLQLSIQKLHADLVLAMNSAKSRVRALLFAIHNITCILGAQAIPAQAHACNNSLALAFVTAVNFLVRL